MNAQTQDGILQAEALFLRKRLFCVSVLFESLNARLDFRVCLRRERSPIVRDRDVPEVILPKRFNMDFPDLVALFLRLAEAVLKAVLQNWL